MGKQLWLGIVMTLLSASSAFAQQNMLVIRSETGDPLGGGITQVIQASDASFSLYNSFENILNASVSTLRSPPQFWSLDLAAPNGLPLTIGTYANAQLPTSPPGAVPGLNFWVNGSSCASIVGKFYILDIAYGSSYYEVQRLAVNFELRCNGAKAKLTGQLRINSNVKVTGLLPIITLTNPLAGNCVEATRPAGATTKFDAANSRDARGGTNLSYAWLTSSGVKSSASTLSFNPGLGGSPANVQLTITDLVTLKTATTSTQVCVADTTPPKIDILSPLDGQYLNDGTSLNLDVRITDLVDKKITKFETSLGSNATYALGANGRSNVILTRPDAGSAVDMALEVRASDKSGNFAYKSIRFFKVNPLLTFVP